MNAKYHILPSNLKAMPMIEFPRLRLHNLRVIEFLRTPPNGRYGANVAAQSENVAFANMNGEISPRADIMRLVRQLLGAAHLVGGHWLQKGA